MKNPLKIVLIAMVSMMLATPSSAQQQAQQGQGYAQQPALEREMRLKMPNRTVRLLPRSVSQSLKILKVPTPEPIPLIVGTYWQCFDAPGDFEVCEPVLVVCTNDQSFCTQVP